MSSQIIPLKSRVDLRGSSRILAHGDHSRLSCGVEEIQLGPRRGSQQRCLRGRWLITEMPGITAIFCRSRDDQAATNPAIAYTLGGVKRTRRQRMLHRLPTRKHSCEITCARRWQGLRGSAARYRALIRSRPCPARRRGPWQRSQARASTARVREAPRASTTPSAMFERCLAHPQRRPQ